MTEAFAVEDTDLVLDALPDDVVSSMEVRDRFMNSLGVNGEAGLEFMVSDLLRWIPGQAVRVAFLDGDAALHGDIMATLTEIADSCNIRFDAGDGNGGFRRWTEADTAHASEIRVSFDKAGYFSLVGTDSVNPNIGDPRARVGGRPNQCSLNLGGFTIQRPATWRGTVRHEFLHALGFHHSHQNMRGPCQAAFRWDDDPRYQPTRDARGTFIADPNGRRPGIYTYLAGHPNNWNRAKVDRNLKTEDNPNVVAGPFDRGSVMLYRFPDSFYKAVPSPCAPSGNGQSLSDGDRRGLRLLYPQEADRAQSVIDAQSSISAALAPAGGAAADAAMGLESAPVETVGNSMLADAAAIIRRNLGLVR
ncbi:MAG: hypothetical protein QOD42_1257 [Sphingomonadales bacterium]|jgi:hypothetical protein|nr:hypothetical protein [Sphingomonadales bacterium]